MNCSIGKSTLIMFALLCVACQETTTEPLNKTMEANSEQGNGEKDQHESEARADEITIAPEALEGQNFKTTVVESKLIKVGIQATANIKPNAYKLAHVSPRIEGKVIKVDAKLGDLVKPGQSLAQLDSIELGYKKSAFRQARTIMLVKKKNYEREKRLFKQQISSEKDYLDAEGAYQQSLAVYQAAFEALELVGLSHKEIERMIKKEGGYSLSSFSLTSPQKGTVIVRQISPGEIITPRDKPFTIADLTTVWILLDIYEEDLATVLVGAKVQITVNSYPGETFRGEVVYLGNLVSLKTRTVEARVEIPNPKGRLRPGMFARATISSSETKGKKTLVVPQDAIQHIDKKPMAFVEKKPGKYERRIVSLGAEDDLYVEILTGLKEGEHVVTKGSFYLKSVMLSEKFGGD